MTKRARCSPSWALEEETAKEKSNGKSIVDFIIGRSLFDQQLTELTELGRRSTNLLVSSNKNYLHEQTLKCLYLDLDIRHQEPQDLT